MDSLNKYNEKTKMNVTLKFAGQKTNQEIITKLSDSYIQRLLSICRLFKKKVS